MIALAMKRLPIAAGKGRAASSRWTSATCSGRCSASAICSAAPEDAVDGAPGRSVAPTSAKTSPLALKTRHSAWRRKSPSVAASCVRAAKAPARRAARRPASAANAMAMGRCAISRDSSAWPAPVRFARARASLIENPCTTCKGHRVLNRPHTLQVKVPPGVEDGTRILYSGHGDTGVDGGPPATST